MKQRSISEGVTNAIEQGKQELSADSHSYESGYHKTWFGEEVYLRSSYEFLMANVLDKLELKYEVESLRISYKSGDSEKVYIPDFFLPEFGLVVETKSKYFLESDNVKEKQRGVIENGYSFVLLSTKKEIKNFSIMSV